VTFIKLRQCVSESEQNFSPTQIDRTERFTNRGVNRPSHRDWTDDTYDE